MMSVGEMVVMKSAFGVRYDGFGTGRGGPINAGGNDGFNVGVYAWSNDGITAGLNACDNDGINAGVNTGGNAEEM